MRGENRKELRGAEGAEDSREEKGAATDVPRWEGTLWGWLQDVS